MVTQLMRKGFEQIEKPVYDKSLWAFYKERLSLGRKMPVLFHCPVGGTLQQVEYLCLLLSCWLCPCRPARETLNS